MQQHEPAGWGVGPSPTTVDEASMERSKSFVKALQELKNLRPQLYSASEYCEKSYLHSEQKQMVLDNLKDYAVRALVNAVDHLGTVAYKLTDLYEQQASEISTMELKVACLNQQVLTCQTYTDKEGLRQQQMTGVATRHHKHYIIPYAGNKRMQAFSQMQVDADIDSTPRPYSSAKTLQWHLVSEKNSKTDSSHQSEFAIGETKATKLASSGQHLHVKESSSSSLPNKHTSNLTSSDMFKVSMKDQTAARPLSASNPEGSSPNKKYAGCFVCQAQISKDEERLCTLIKCKTTICWGFVTVEMSGTRKKLCIHVHHICILCISGSGINFFPQCFNVILLMT